jgi:hypothetical protein
MENVKYMLQEAGAKVNSAIGDIEDLTISKNHKVNILDVLEELKAAREIIYHLQGNINTGNDRYFINRETGIREPFKLEY